MANLSSSSMRMSAAVIALSFNPPACPSTKILWNCLSGSIASRRIGRRITAVLPYFGYARQDRKSEGRTPITAKLVANLITAAGNRVIAMDLHAAQVQGFFDIPVDHLLASPVFKHYYVDEQPKLGKLAIVSPDPGNLKAASWYAEILNADLAFIDKRRQSATSVAMTSIVGDIVGKTVLMFDDMITTGGTVAEASRILMDRGAREVHVAATHGIFAGPAIDRLEQGPDRPNCGDGYCPAGRTSRGSRQQAQGAFRGVAAGQNNSLDPL